MEGIKTKQTIVTVQCFEYLKAQEHRGDLRLMLSDGWKVIHIVRISEDYDYDYILEKEL